MALISYDKAVTIFWKEILQSNSVGNVEVAKVANLPVTAVGGFDY